MSITTKNQLGFTACLPNHHLGKKRADRIRDTLGERKMPLFQNCYLEKVLLLVHLGFIDSNTVKGQDLALDLPKASFE